MSKNLAKEKTVTDTLSDCAQPGIPSNLQTQIYNFTSSLSKFYKDQHRSNPCCQVGLQQIAWKFHSCNSWWQDKVPTKLDCPRSILFLDWSPYELKSVVFKFRKNLKFATEMFDLQLTKQRPRWHFVDIGQMSEPFLDSAVLRDDVHPNTDVMMTVLQMYLNLHVDHGKPLPPVQFPIQGFKEWDSQDFTEKVTRWMEDYHRQKPKYHPSPPSYSSTSCLIFRSSIFWCSCAKGRDDFAGQACLCEMRTLKMVV